MPSKRPDSGRPALSKPTTAVACTAPGCQRQAVARGLCMLHYKRARAGQRPSLTAAQLDGACARVAAGVSKAVVARDLGVHHSTLYRALTRQRGRATSEETVVS